MSSRMRGLAICMSILIIGTVFGSGLVFAQDDVYAGRNINMVSGLYYSGEEGQPVTIGGDPYLQRQNEPSIAVSTRNPMHLLAGANDYRTVDIPFSDTEMVGDSWLGLFKSFDGGQTWQSTLLPDYPQSSSGADAIGCPKKHDGTDMDSILGCQAAADPTVKAGTNGMFYYSGVAFDRDKKNLSRLFVSRFIDLNNREGAFFDVPAHKDPIKYIDTRVVNIGTPGQFTDKPWLAVDIPRTNAETVDFYIEDYKQTGDAADNIIEEPITVHQSFKCGNVYLAYAVFLGNFGNAKLDKPVTEKEANKTHTRIEVMRSTDCGETWEKNKGNISAGFHVNQGVTLAVDPKDGHVYVAWQVFDFKNQKPQVVVAKSTDFGEHFTQRVTVAETKPFNQGTRPANSDDPFRLFRTNAYPTMAIDNDGRVYVAWSERGEWGKDYLPPEDLDGIKDGSRIKLSHSGDGGQDWATPYPVDVSDTDCDPATDDKCQLGHRIMPSLSHTGGRLSLLFYNFRNDYYPGLYDTILEKFDCDSIADPDLCKDAQEMVPLDLSLPPADAAAFEPFPVRHTLETWVITAEATSSGPADFSASNARPVSKYASTLLPDPNDLSEPWKEYQLQSNQVNLPLFLKGTSPFIGDYIDIAASQTFIPTVNGGWEYQPNVSDASIFHAVWTDNRDVMPPPAKIVEKGPGKFELERPDWTEYQPPSGAVWPDDAWPGMRNQNVYTSRITHGLVLGTYGNSKPLNIERAFSIFIENTIPEFEKDANDLYLPKSRKYELAVEAPASGKACFSPFTAAGNCPAGGESKSVEVTSLGRAAVNVFAKKLSGADLLIPITVTAKEVDPDTDTVMGNGLQSSLVLNPDPTNPDPLNADAEGNDLLDSETRKLEIVPFSCSDFEEMPGEVLTNCGNATASVSSLLIEWPALYDISDPAFPNPALLNPALLNTTENPALLNPALLNPALLNPALLNPALLNPALLNPALLNPALLNPALLNPALLNPALLNPALLNPALLNPALLNPALLNNPSTPALLNPALLNPALLNPALLNPALLNPTPGAGNSLNLGTIAKNTWLIQDTDLVPEESSDTAATLTDLTWRVKNVGNNGSSYFFSWFSDLGFDPDQILIYRTYKTPSIDPGSYLLNEAGLHYEFLLNVRMQDLVDDPLDPIPLNAALSFSVAPISRLQGGGDEDYIYITLRFTDSDGQGGLNTIDPDDVGITLEPEASAEGSSTPQDTPTSTAVFSSTNPVNYGHVDEVTLTAKVNSTSEDEISGTVTFIVDGIQISSPQQVVDNEAELKLDPIFFPLKLKPGSHTIEAEYNGDPGDFRKSKSRKLIQNVSMLSQSITFDPLPDITYGQVPEITLVASTTSSLKVSFSTNSNKKCSVSDGNKLKIHKKGKCIVKASQAGNSTFLPAEDVVRDFRITP